MGTIVDSEQTAHVSEHNSTKNMLSCCPGSVPLPVVISVTQVEAKTMKIWSTKSLKIVLGTNKSSVWVHQ